jgi:prephenate dehydrogenase
MPSLRDHLRDEGLMSALENVLVVGTGLIGTSIALALRDQGIAVRLADRDAGAVRVARELGAGEEWTPGRPVDLAVIAVPPQFVAEQLADLQCARAARWYTDVASVKALPIERAARLGCDLGSYVAGHPLAGRERSGPAAARADLFLGRPWAYCPVEQTSPEAVEIVLGLIKLCGGEAVRVAPAEHDRAVAVVSHAPHVAASAVAARLAEAPEAALGLAGQGVRDVTRIAASDPGLWTGILSGNALPVADVLEAVASDLAAVAAALRAAAAGDDPAAMDRVTELLGRGVTGTGRIPGKHGGPARTYSVVQVVVGDRPGELARLFEAAREAGVNIEDVRLEHAPGLPLGMAEISVQPAAAETLAVALRAGGWHVPS